jgi:hypothetical protein
MAAKAVGNFCVFVHTDAAPTDEQWDQVLDFYRGAADPSTFRTLVFTEGAAPNAAQRARLKTATRGAKIPIAVLTSSAVARAAGIAIGWFNPLFRAFGPEELERALDHLDAQGLDRELLKLTLEELKSLLKEAQRRAG